MTRSILFQTDSYKYSHYKQYPSNTETVYEYVESRGGKFPETVFFGLQPLLEQLARPITQQDIDAADKFVTAHIGPGIFNREGFQYILDQHGGYLPIRIKAVPEGTVVPTKNILVSVENTDPKCFWLPSFVETCILRACWYGTTVASFSYSIKNTIKRYLEQTGDPSLLPFKLHDFGARGVSSAESAGIGGAAHLVNFMGSDTVEGILYAQEHYNTDDMLGFSIAAAEHSTMTSWGGRDGEVNAMNNMLDQFLQPGKIVACVSDSYDIYHAIIQHWGTTLKDQIVNSGGVLVVRPDSGEPVEVTLRCVELLGEKFGYTVNSKGFKVLHPSVRLIQGDGIDDVMVGKILATYAENGWSADNINFGCGGGLLQKLDRDTQRFAMKCSSIKVNDKWRDVFKDPVTDSGKKSKKGRLMLYKDITGKIYTACEGGDGDHAEEILETVFLNGKVTKTYTFEEVRANAK